MIKSIFIYLATLLKDLEIMLSEVTYALLAFETVGDPFFCLRKLLKRKTQLRCQGTLRVIQQQKRMLGFQ